MGAPIHNAIANVIRRLPLALIVWVSAMSREATAQAETAKKKVTLTAIDGVVTDTSLIPLADAKISIFGSAIRVTTRDDGRFRIVDIQPGQYLLFIQRLGYEATSAKLTIDNGDTARVSFVLESISATLSPVVISADALPPRLAEFEARRRNHEATATVTREDILKRNPVDAWQMLSGTSSVEITPGGPNGQMLASSTRIKKISSRGLIPCYMTVMIDGLIMLGDNGGPFDLSRLPPPAAIYGIEVFAGAASTPLAYGGEGKAKDCGLIAVWTR